MFDDYKEMPPVKYFIRVLKNCPQASYLYMQIWKKKDKNRKIIIQKEDVRKNFLISPTVFKNFLGRLTYLNVLQYTEKDACCFEIEVFGKYMNE